MLVVKRDSVEKKLASQLDSVEMVRDFSTAIVDAANRDLQREEVLAEGFPQGLVLVVHPQTFLNYGVKVDSNVEITVEIREEDTYEKEGEDGV